MTWYFWWPWTGVVVMLVVGLHNKTVDDVDDPTQKVLDEDAADAVDVEDLIVKTNWNLVDRIGWFGYNRLTDHFWFLSMMINFQSYKTSFFRHSDLWVRMCVFFSSTLHQLFFFVVFRPRRTYVISSVVFNLYFLLRYICFEKNFNEERYIYIRPSIDFFFLFSFTMLVLLLNAVFVCSSFSRTTIIIIRSLTVMVCCILFAF